MLRVLGGILMIALAAPASRAEGDATKAAETLKKLQDEFKKAQADFNKALRAAKTPQEQQDIIANQNPTPKFQARFYEFAEKNSKDPAAVEALNLCLSPPYLEKALEL